MLLNYSEYSDIHILTNCIVCTLGDTRKNPYLENPFKIEFCNTTRSRIYIIYVLLLIFSSSHQSFSPVLLTSSSHQSFSPVLLTSPSQQFFSPVLLTSSSQQFFSPVLLTSSSHPSSLSFASYFICFLLLFRSIFNALFYHVMSITKIIIQYYSITLKI